MVNKRHNSVEVLLTCQAALVRLLASSTEKRVGCGRSVVVYRGLEDTETDGNIVRRAEGPRCKAGMSWARILRL